MGVGVWGCGVWHKACGPLFLHLPRWSTLCQKTVRWYLGNCRLWGREPDSTSALAVSGGWGWGGRQDVSACITSRWAPSEAKVSGQITSHNGRDHKRQPQSHAPLHTEGEMCTAQPSNCDVLESVGGLHGEDLMSVDTSLFFMTEQG